MAKEIQASAESTLGIKLIVVDVLSYEDGSDGLVLAEPFRTDASSIRPRGLFWTSLSARISNLSEQELWLVHQALIRGQTDHGAFACFGWLPEVLDWIRIEAPRTKGLEVLGVTQFAASSTSTLMRVEFSDGITYWMKADMGADSQEFNTTRTLVALFPEFLPLTVAFRRDWRAWLMDDAGIPLHGSSHPNILNRALKRLAELQRRSIPHVTSMIAGGFLDWRMSVIRDGVLRVPSLLEEAMEAQDFDRASRFNRSALDDLCGRAHECCARLNELQIPDTLVHTDLHFGNILFGRRDCVFGDWSHAAVGNPFLSFQHLQAQIALNRKLSSPQRTFGAWYRTEWRGLLRADQVNAAIPLSSILAIAAELSNVALRPPKISSDMRMYRRLRSLARQMHRALQELREQTRRTA